MALTFSSNNGRPSSIWRRSSRLRSSPMTAVCRQCQRHAVHGSGRGEVHDCARQGRQDHQFFLTGRTPGRSACHSLLRKQGGRHFHDAVDGLNLIKHGINVNGIAPPCCRYAHVGCGGRAFCKIWKTAHREKSALSAKGALWPQGKPEDLVGCAIFLALQMRVTMLSPRRSTSMAAANG